MYFDIPVIAYASTAIPDTLGGSGILIKGKDYLEVAALIDLLMEDHSLRQVVVSGQRKRLARFNVDDTRRQWAECINFVENSIGGS
jgi:glycosyltransferase involved in cell wall biosynthesis